VASAGVSSRPPKPSTVLGRHTRSSPEQRGEADQGADDVGQVRADELGDRELAGDVAQRADDGQQPAVAQSPPTADQVDEDPGRQQGEDRDDLADGRGQRQQRQAGHGGQSDDGRAEGAVGDRCVVGDRGHPDGGQVGHSQRDQDGSDHRPGVAEADQAFHERAEGPGQQQCLNPDVGVAWRSASA
jgi:hypothetical protein